MEEAYRTALACLPALNILSMPRLIEMTGDAQALWKILEAGGARAAALLGADKAGQCRDAARSMSPTRILQELNRQGIRAVMPSHQDFPPRLSAIYDPPAVLFMKGGSLPRDSIYVSIVGSRKASGYGKWVSETLGSQLARLGIVIVSGAAYGVDAHAHIGCLRTAGFTVAVLGCGIDRIYPAGHARLFHDIADHGCLVSEYPPGAEPLPWRFPHRNRIIAGLSHAVVVVEAGEKSGALITADMALEEGREVLAVPGPINSILSEGTNALIQKGAKLVRNIEDICEELPGAFTTPRSACEAVSENNVPPQPAELTIVDLLRGGPRSLDWLSVRCDRPVSELLPTLTEMTLRGWVADEAGGKYRLLKDPEPREKKAVARLL
jgi:DNA processing protein